MRAIAIIAILICAASPSWAQGQAFEQIVGQARDAYRQDNYDEAIRLYTVAIDSGSKNIYRSYRQRGKVFADQGLYDQAIKEFSHAIQWKKLYAPTYRDRGYVYAAIGLDDLAERDYAIAKRLEDGAYIGVSLSLLPNLELLLFGAALIVVLAGTLWAFWRPPQSIFLEIVEDTDAVALNFSFTEQQPYEKGFAEIFERDIAPHLEALEHQRIIGNREWRRGSIITLSCTFLILIVSMFLYFAIGTILLHRISYEAAPILLILPLGVFFLGCYWVGRRRNQHHSALRVIITDAISEFYGGLQYYRKPEQRFGVGRFTKLGLISGVKGPVVDDLFIGCYRETEFKMMDGLFADGTGWIAFRGLLFEIDVPTEFSCHVLIGRDQDRMVDALKAFFKGNFAAQQRIFFDDAAFEKHYAVHADDDDEAHELMSPHFCKTMVALADAYKGKTLSAAFVDGVFLLAVPLPGNLFEPNSVLRSLNDCEDDVHEFLRLITIARLLIDCFHGDRPREAA